MEHERAKKQREQASEQRNQAAHEREQAQWQRTHYRGEEIKPSTAVFPGHASPHDPLVRFLYLVDRFEWWRYKAPSRLAWSGFVTFIRYQRLAIIQTIAFLSLMAGLALIGATFIKIGLAIEGALIIAITCVLPVFRVGPATFLHFIRVPREYYD